ncbi:MAG: SH3 domain-containing protein [Allorhizobium sp.]
MDRHRKFWLGTVLLLSLAVPPARADYVGGLNPAGDNFLALRTGPGSGYRMIMPMGPGTYLTVIGRDGRWLNVELQDGTRGWAYDAYIYSGSPPDDDFGGPPPDMAPPGMAPPDMAPPGMAPIGPGGQPPPFDPGDEAPPSDMGGDPPQAEPTDAVQPPDSGEADNAGVPADPMASNWITYRNDRFGTRIDYSAPMFRMLPPPENNDGRTFEAKDGSARFIVFGSHNVFDSTLDELIEEHLAGLGEGEKVTQRRKGENWYLHSGFRGDDFFLRKVLLSDDGAVIHTFEISYAKGLKPKLDPMAARMAQSLRTADEEAESPGQAPETDADQPAAMAPAGSVQLGTGAAPSGTGMDGWRSHSFEGFTLSAPADWTARVEGDTLNLKAPDGKRNLMIWWWFPDEPMLGYSDTVSNHKVTVDGKPALWIHSKFEGMETLTVTLDEGRADKKRLHFLFEATGGIRLGGGEPDFDRILESVTIGDVEGKAGVPEPKANQAAIPRAPPSKAEAADGNAAEPEEADDEERRAWVGRTSVEVPTGWEVKPDEDIAGGIIMTRPGEGAEIAVTFWPRDKPMPSDEVKSLEYAVVLGRPATVLELSEGRMLGRQIFFDEPRGDGARLTLAYRAFGEDLADGLPLFELVLASLDQTMPPPEGTEMPAVVASAGSDPFADIELSDLEMDPR